MCVVLAPRSRFCCSLLLDSFSSLLLSSLLFSFKIQIATPPAAVKAADSAAAKAAAAGTESWTFGSSEAFRPGVW